MSGGANQIQDWRRTRLFGPIVAMVVTGLVLLVVLSIFLIERFDVASADRERAIVERGIVEQAKELDAVVATQVNWDKAIAKLDNKIKSARQKLVRKK